MKAEKIFSVKNKTVVLTGASGFLGRKMTEVLLENQARVIAIGRTTKIKELGRKWEKKFPAQIKTVQVDMNNRKVYERELHRILESERRIHVLINNAHELSLRTGFNTPSGSLENMTFDQWARHFSGGLFWAVQASQIIGTSMKRNHGGSIINVSSMYGTVAPSPLLYDGTPFLNPPGYSASKAALLAFTRYVASFWGRSGIRANAIVPGPFSNTEDTSANSVSRNDPFLDRLRLRTCLGRVGEPQELFGVLLFLASDASSYMTGQALVVDGGWTVI